MIGMTSLWSVASFAGTSSSTNNGLLDSHSFLADTPVVSTTTQDESPDFSKFETQKKDVLELGVSTWNPTHIALPSQVSNTSLFEADHNPTFTASYLSAPFYTSQKFNLQSKFGMGYSQLQRTGTLNGSSTVQTQNLYLLTPEAGVQLTPNTLRFGSAQPYISESITPILGLADRSIFDNGDNNLKAGIAGLTQIGLQWRLKNLLSGNDGIIDAYGIGSLGSISGSTLNTAGIGLSLGITL